MPCCKRPFGNLIEAQARIDLVGRTPLGAVRDKSSVGSGRQRKRSLSWSRELRASLAIQVQTGVAARRAGCVLSLRCPAAVSCVCARSHQEFRRLHDVIVQTEDPRGRREFESLSSVTGLDCLEPSLDESLNATYRTNGSSSDDKDASTQLGLPTRSQRSASFIEISSISGSRLAKG